MGSLKGTPCASLTTAPNALTAEDDELILAYEDRVLLQQFRREILLA